MPENNDDLKVYYERIEKVQREAIAKTIEEAELDEFPQALVNEGVGKIYDVPKHADETGAEFKVRLVGHLRGSKYKS